jgi:hypothetical protein
LTGPLFFKRTRQKIKNKKAATSQIPAGCAIFWAFSVKILSYFLVLLSHIITDPPSKTRTRQRKVLLHVRQNICRKNRVSGCLNHGHGIVSTCTEEDMDVVMTSPASCVTDSSKIMPDHRNVERPIRRIRHILTRGAIFRHFPPNARA